MSEQWVFELTQADLDRVNEELHHRKPRENTKKFKLPPPETYQEYLERDKLRDKSKYQVPYHKRGELEV